MVEAYHGDQPFVFVSYSHADSELVLAELQKLQTAGFRIWYDEGINPGNDWPEEIARALDCSSLFLVFITPRSVASTNVQNEINFALNRRKSFLAVHLEETTLPAGLELRMGDIQAIKRHYIAEERYRQKIHKVLATTLGEPSVLPAGMAITSEQANQSPPAEIDTRGVKVQALPRVNLQTREHLRDLNLKQPLTSPIASSETSVCLRFPTAAGERNVSLAGGFRFRLGKDRSNDVVLRVLPPSKDNNEKSLQLSGHHADIHFRDGEVVWRNANCPNGTVIGGQSLGLTDQLPLQHGVTIQAASVLRLIVDLYHQEAFDPDGDYSAFDLQPVVEDGPRTAPEEATAIRIRRTDELAALEQYVLFPRSVLIGRDLGCPVLIADPSMQERHARLLLLRSGLWIEPVSAEAFVSVDGQTLKPNELARIVPNTQVQCGDVSILVMRRFQHYLGWLDLN